MHPKGDEWVVLLAGTATMLLKHEKDQEAIDLTQVSQYVIVPKATWHTAKITAYAKLLFVTPSEGMQNQASAG